MKGDDDEEPQAGPARAPNETKRSSRNLSEKKRRDRFNILVQELAGIVSPEDGRKLEKTAVLELAISYLREHQSQPELSSLPRANRNTAKNAANWQPSFTTDAEFNLIVTEAFDSFTIAIENDGNILYASHSVLSLLGYLTDQLVGTSLFSYVHEDDALRIWSQLARIAAQQNGADETGVLTNSDPFLFRMKCGRLYSRCSYQTVHCKVAVLRQSNDQETVNCLIFVGKVERPQPNRIVTNSDCAEKEFSYRLTLDWKYVYIDHRAPSIIGFLPFEVLGTSVYEYCGPEDVSNIAQYHKLLIRLGKITTCYYRHLTKGQSWVWLRSSCYISYNQWNSKPESITCTATVVTFDEVCANQIETIQRDRDHFARIISRAGSDVSYSSWASSPTSTQEESTDQQDGTTADDQKETSRDVLNGPTDQLMNGLVNQSTDVDMESDDEQNEALLWLEQITLPPGLTAEQIETHSKLQEEYKKIAEQLRKQGRQLKTIMKLIEWSKLLLELDSNFGVFGESSVDSEASSS